LLRAAILLSLALCGCAAWNPHSGIDRLVVFGDSNVDNGNGFRITKGVNPGPPNWRGRNCNGPVVTEYLAQLLGVKEENYAVSGATTGALNLSAEIDPEVTAMARTGLLAQIEEFAAKGGRLGRGDIVMVWAASNDLFGVSRSDGEKLRQRIATARRNMLEAVERLHKLGARRIVVAGRTPRADLGTDDDLDGIDINEAIRAAVSTDPEVIFFDAYGVIADVVRHPQRHGITEPVRECLAVPSCISESYDKGLDVANGFVNFDGAHKTTRTHRIMAEKLLRVLR